MTYARDFYSYFYFFISYYCRHQWRAALCVLNHRFPWIYVRAARRGRDRHKWRRLVCDKVGEPYSVRDAILRQSVESSRYFWYGFETQIGTPRTHVGCHFSVFSFSYLLLRFCCCSCNEESDVFSRRATIIISSISAALLCFFCFAVTDLRQPGYCVLWCNMTLVFIISSKHWNVFRRVEHYFLRWTTLRNILRLSVVTCWGGQVFSKILKHL